MAQLTVLNTMAGANIERSFNQQLEWDIQDVDLKDQIYGKKVHELSIGDAEELSRVLKQRGMRVFCMSTSLFHEDMELGAEVFANHLEQVNHTIEVAKRLQPKVIGLIAANSSLRSEFTNSLEYMKEQHPWLLPMYQQAIDWFTAAGFQVTIENESQNNIFSKPEEVLGFFAALKREGKVSFTYDVSNFWQMGTYPSLEVCKMLTPLVGYLHLKGGTANQEDELEWNVSLEDTAWPVVEMTKFILSQGHCSAVCLNPSHGKKKPEYDYDNIIKRDLEFMRGSVAELQ